MKASLVGDMSKSKIVNCAMLGDGMVGKTCLAVSCTESSVFPDVYTATVFDNYPVHYHVNDTDFVISVFDNAGQSDFEELRAYTYKESEVLVLCFSVIDRDTFSSVCNSWIPEIKRHTKRRRPVILVGTQIDMRTGQNEAEVTPEEGEAMAKLIGADVYLECSAKNRLGLEQIFENVVTAGLRYRKKKHNFIGRLFHR